MKRNYTFDTIKTLACFFVICIHYPFSGEFGVIMQNIGRFAVPFFFMISGYYTNLNAKNINEKINDRFRDILKLTCISFIFYLAINIVVVILKDGLIDYLNIIKNPLNIMKLLVFNYTTPYIGVGHLWYLFALMYVYILVKFVHEHKLTKFSYIYSVICLIAVYVLECIKFYKGWRFESIWWRNFLFFGFPCFMIGNYFNKQREKMNFEAKTFKIINISFLFIIFFCIYIENKLFNNQFNLYINSILISIFLFINAINKPNVEFAKKNRRRAFTKYLYFTLFYNYIY